MIVDSKLLATRALFNKDRNNLAVAGSHFVQFVHASEVGAFNCLVKSRQLVRRGSWSQVARAAPHCACFIQRVLSFLKCSFPYFTCSLSFSFFQTHVRDDVRVHLQCPCSLTHVFVQLCLTSFLYFASALGCQSPLTICHVSLVFRCLPSATSITMSLSSSSSLPPALVTVLALALRPRLLAPPLLPPSRCRWW